MRLDQQRDLGTAFGIELLAVVDAGGKPARQALGQDHGGRNHRPRQGTTPNLVDPAHHAIEPTFAGAFQSGGSGSEFDHGGGVYESRVRDASVIYNLLSKMIRDD